MKSIISLFIFLFLFCLASCQVKEVESSGGSISDINLSDSGGTFDITSPSASINLDGPTTSGTSHDVNLTTS